MALYLKRMILNPYEVICNIYWSTPKSGCVWERIRGELLAAGITIWMFGPAWIVWES